MPQATERIYPLVTFKFATYYIILEFWYILADKRLTRQLPVTLDSCILRNVVPIFASSNLRSASMTLLTKMQTRTPITNSLAGRQKSMMCSEKQTEGVQTANTLYWNGIFSPCSPFLQQEDFTLRHDSDGGS